MHIVKECKLVYGFVIIELEDFTCRKSIIICSIFSLPTKWSRNHWFSVCNYHLVSTTKLLDSKPYNKWVENVLNEWVINEDDYKSENISILSLARIHFQFSSSFCCCHTVCSIFRSFDHFAAFPFLCFSVETFVFVFRLENKSNWH